ncbi:MAG: hypothetical protein ACKPKO_30015, partial [Candidatus Fonsibacter sp.]
NMEDPRYRRWAWWLSLSEACIFMKQVYEWTEHKSCSNAVASGNPGQEVSKTRMGTVTWVPSDTRLIVSTANVELLSRLCTVFEPWIPERDLGKKYHRGKIPQQIREMLHTRSQSRETTTSNSQVFH